MKLAKEKKVSGSGSCHRLLVSPYSCFIVSVALETLKEGVTGTSGLYLPEVSPLHRSLWLEERIAVWCRCAQEGGGFGRKEVGAGWSVLASPFSRHQETPASFILL
ncbi:MAG: hypothetical protein JW945_07295 [Methanomicrobia archaeon]|nr:hypothetical protein [Methanomicrobia archaeon]